MTVGCARCGDTIDEPEPFVVTIGETRVSVLQEKWCRCGMTYVRLHPDGTLGWGGPSRPIIRDY